MQRINLLPPYIYDKKKKATVVGVWAAACVLVIIALAAYAGKVSSDLSQAQTEKQNAEAQKARWDAAEGKIQDIQKAMADTKAKLDFIQNAKKWNDAWPELYSMMRDWTSPDILLTSMALDPQQHSTLNLTGFAADERRIIQWWMLLENNPRFKQPIFNIPPRGYTPENAQTAGGPTGFGGRAPYGAGMGGPPPGMMGGPPMGMMSGYASMSGMGRPGGGFSGMGRPGGFGGVSPGTGSSGSVGPTEIEGRRGIAFTASCPLAQPFAGGITQPTWPAGAGRSATGAMGYGGMMGGMGMMGRAGMMGGPPMGMPGGPGGGSAMSGGGMSGGGAAAPRGGKAGASEE